MRYDSIEIKKKISFILKINVIQLLYEQHEKHSLEFDFYKSKILFRTEKSILSPPPPIKM